MDFRGEAKTLKEFFFCSDTCLKEYCEEVPGAKEPEPEDKSETESDTIGADAEGTGDEAS